MSEFFSKLINSPLAEQIFRWGVRGLIALLILYVGFKLAKHLAKLAAQALGRAGVDPTAANFLRRVIYSILLAALIVGVLELLRVPITPLVGVLGAAGLAIGLALKDSLSNIASGVMLVTLRPFKVGDIVTIADATGKVELVSIFQTILRGADNQTFVIPNNLITSSPIINLTPDIKRRIEIVIGIGYNDDIDKARSTAMSIMTADERVLDDPKADVVVYNLGDNAVQLGIRCHTRNDDWFAVKAALQENIKKAFDEAGISIPYPQRTVHVHHHSNDKKNSADMM